MSESLEQQVLITVPSKSATLELYRVCTKKVFSGTFEERKIKFQNCIEKSKKLTNLENEKFTFLLEQDK
jgi:hypothetical protein